MTNKLFISKSRAKSVAVKPAGGKAKTNPGASPTSAGIQGGVGLSSRGGKTIGVRPGGKPIYESERKERTGLGSALGPSGQTQKEFSPKLAVNPSAKSSKTQSSSTSQPRQQNNRKGITASHKGRTLTIIGRVRHKGKEWYLVHFSDTDQVHKVEADHFHEHVDNGNVVFAKDKKKEDIKKASHSSRSYFKDLPTSNDTLLKPKTLKDRQAEQKPSEPKSQVVIKPPLAKPGVDHSSLGKTKSGLVVGNKSAFKTVDSHTLKFPDHWTEDDHDDARQLHEAKSTHHELQADKTNDEFHHYAANFHAASAELHQGHNWPERHLPNFDRQRAINYSLKHLHKHVYHNSPGKTIGTTKNGYKVYHNSALLDPDHWNENDHGNAEKFHEDEEKKAEKEKNVGKQLFHKYSKEFHGAVQNSMDASFHNEPAEHYNEHATLRQIQAAGLHDVVYPEHAVEDQPKKSLFIKSTPGEPGTTTTGLQNKIPKKLSFQGLPVSIENMKGSYRSGKGWKTLMKHDYGYVKGTRGFDGDQLDVFVGPNHEATHAFVVKQINPKTRVYDEDKVMLGFNSVEQAKRAYLQHYDSPKFYGGIREIPMDAFKIMLKYHKGKKLNFTKDERFVHKSLVIKKSSLDDFFHKLDKEKGRGQDDWKKDIDRKFLGKPAIQPKKIKWIDSNNGKHSLGEADHGFYHVIRGEVTGKHALDYQPKEGGDLVGIDDKGRQLNAANTYRHATLNDAKRAAEVHSSNRSISKALVIKASRPSRSYFKDIPINESTTLKPTRNEKLFVGSSGEQKSSKPVIKETVKKPIIGQTRSGKNIHHDSALNYGTDWTKDDHLDASLAHEDRHKDVRDRANKYPTNDQLAYKRDVHQHSAVLHGINHSDPNRPTKILQKKIHFKHMAAYDNDPGKILGYTSNNKKVYHHSAFSAPTSWTFEDHDSAALLHEKAYKRLDKKIDKDLAAGKKINALDHEKRNFHYHSFKHHIALVDHHNAMQHSEHDKANDHWDNSLYHAKRAADYHDYAYPKYAQTVKKSARLLVKARTEEQKIRDAKSTNDISGVTGYMTPDDPKVGKDWHPEEDETNSEFTEKAKSFFTKLSSGKLFVEKGSLDDFFHKLDKEKGRNQDDWKKESHKKFLNIMNRKGSGGKTGLGTSSNKSHIGITSSGKKIHSDSALSHGTDWTTEDHADASKLHKELHNKHFNTFNSVATQRPQQPLSAHLGNRDENDSYKNSFHYFSHDYHQQRADGKHLAKPDEARLKHLHRLTYENSPGNVIGTTKRGFKIYHNSAVLDPPHFNSDDHDDAAQAHTKLSNFSYNAGEKRKELYHEKSVDFHNNKNEEYKSAYPSLERTRFEKEAEVSRKKAAFMHNDAYPEHTIKSLKNKSLFIVV